MQVRFKRPLAIRPLFLHSPKRVESLVFLNDYGFDDILFAAAYVIKLFKPLDFPTTLAPRGGAENKVKRKTVPFPSD